MYAGRWEDLDHAVRFKTRRTRKVSTGGREENPKRAGFVCYCGSGGRGQRAGQIEWDRSKGICRG